MGSLPPASHLPDASDETLVLTHPTAAEQEQTWRLNHREWGGPLDLPAYLKREPFLASTPLAADGGMVHWILTEEKDVAPSSMTAHPRRVLASCETIRKRVLYVPRGADDVREGIGYGIGSVYTYPEFRGKKYAARMLKELGVVLKKWPQEEQLPRKKRSQKQGLGNGVSDTSRVANGVASPEQTNGQNTKPDENEVRGAVCSALWSDIGKRFYASKGWPAFPSEHVEFPSSSPSSPPGVSSLLEQSNQPHGTALTLAPVNTSNIAPLCREDEAQLRAELLRHARATGRTAFAFAPDPDVFRWHWAREEFIVSHVFPGREASEVRGLIATVQSSQSTPDIPGGGEANGAKSETKTTRMWAIWTRNYGAEAASNTAKNTLYILRLVIDNNGSAETTPSATPSSSAAAAAAAAAADPKALQLAFDAILHGALDAARAWNCGTVHLWNPTPAARELIAGSGVAHKFVNRELDSIPSLMWYGADDKKAEKKGEEGEEVEEEEEEVDWLANEKYCWC
ncbi:hypothetical protein F5Y07DRAFT_20366 [Xylaria sp. FL0933]|nr:hypothetical protein F5Y07DRAFT_20366 [Xylaria sp. FL0933]